jgi:hypothetical protein
MSTTRPARTPAATPASEPVHATDAPARPATPRAWRSAGVRELAIAALVLTVVGVAGYAANILDSGFSTDDWSNAALSLQSSDGVGGVLRSYADLTPYRPVLILYVPATYWVFGIHMGLHLAWAVVLAIFVSTMLYGILRSCGLARTHALAIGILLLIYPWADSTRMWPTASMATFAIGLALAGVWVALAGLRAGSYRRHALAVALYLLSALTYELTVGLICSAGLLYVLRAGWRPAWRRWAADLVAMGAAAAWNFSTTPRTAATDLSALLDHLWSIVVQGGSIVAYSAHPLAGPDRKTLVLLVLLGVLVLTVAVAVIARRSPRWNGRLRSWLLLFAAGAAVTVLGWAPFVPADPYYTPSIYGFTNRVNALAAVGVVMALYALAGMIGALVGAARPRSPLVATAVTLVLAAVLGAGYLKVLDRHSDLWVGAFRGEMAALGQIRGAYPKLPDGAVVHTFGYPGYQAPGVPVFAVSWDLRSALKLQYKDDSVGGYPVVAPAAVRCEPAGVVIAGGTAFAEPRTTPYGDAILFDVPTGRHAQPRDIGECRRSLPAFTPGPLELQVDY